ncbi:hypothetical protein Dimus_013308 [Dionaea muscipula]
MKKRVIRGKLIRENWMNDNGLSDVMNLIKKQKWEILFRRRELMHVTACKEFFANLTVSLFKKKEVATSIVRGVKIDLDSMILASILGVPGNTGICEYIKDFWEETKFCMPQEITRKFANDKMITTARKTFLTMCQLKRENGVWWLGTGEQRRRDDEEEIPTENVKNEEAANEGEEVHQDDFEWEVVNEEDEIQGESGSAEKFYDAEDEVQGSADVIKEVPEVPAPVSAQ